MESAARKSSLHDNSNMDATVTSTNVTKPKRRSLVERELETNMTARVTTAASGSEGRASTSRYGRTRRLKEKTELSGTEKSPSNVNTPVKSPAYKMYASNSDNKIDSGEVTIPIKIEDQIETIYSKNLSLSRFGSVENTNSPAKKFSKVYTRKDLIQGKKREETSSTVKSMFSPSKSPCKPSTHLSNILERSEKCSLDSVEKYTAQQNGTPSVVKTLDFDSGKKAKKDVNKSTISKSEIFEIEAQCSYQVGDLAWARVGTYPFWPCIVTRDPYGGTFVKRKWFGRVERDVLHVTFFGDNGRRGWIVENMMRRYSGLMEFNATRDNITAEVWSVSNYMSVLLYAGDQVLLASSTDDLQKMATIMDDAFTRKAIKIKVGKTEDKKKDPKYYASFFISEKKLIPWVNSVEEANILLREPKRLRMEILNEMINKYRAVKLTPTRQRQSGASFLSQHNRTANDVSLSESLFDTLFSEDDSKTDDQAKSKKRPRNTSLDVSEVVTACIDSMAAKTGIPMVQKQSHMDRWLQKAKSKTPEKPQSILIPSKVKETKTVAKKAINNSAKLEQQKKPFDEVTPNKSYSSKEFASDSHLYDSLGSVKITKAFHIHEHDYSKLSDRDPEIKFENIPAADNDVDTTDKNKCGIGFISKVEALCDKPEERPDNQVDCANCEIEMSVTTDEFVVTELENESYFAETDITTELEDGSDIVTELKDKSNFIKSDVVTNLEDKIDSVVENIEDYPSENQTKMDVVTSQDVNHKLYLIKSEAPVPNEVSTSNYLENYESQISGKIPSNTIVSPSSVTFKLSTKGLNIVIEANNSFQETTHTVTTNEEIIRKIDYDKKRDKVYNEQVLANEYIEQNCANECRTTIDDILERELPKTSKNKGTKKYDKEIHVEVHENSETHMLINRPIIYDVTEGSNEEIPIKTIKKSNAFDTKQNYPKAKSHGSDMELEVLDVEKEDNKSFDDIIEHITDKTTSGNIIKIDFTKETQDLQTARDLADEFSKNHEENASEFPIETAQSNLIAKDMSNASLEIPIISEDTENFNEEVLIKAIEESNTCVTKQKYHKAKSEKRDMELEVYCREKEDKKSSHDIIELCTDKKFSENTIINASSNEIQDLQTVEDIADEFSKNHEENASGLLMKTAQCNPIGKDISSASLETPKISEFTEDSNEEILIKTIKESNTFDMKQNYPKVSIADKFSNNHKENATKLPMKFSCDLIVSDISNALLETRNISEFTEVSNEEIPIKTIKESNIFDMKEKYPTVKSEKKYMELEVFGTEKEDKKSSHGIIELSMDQNTSENTIKNASTKEIQDLQTVEDIADKFSINHEGNVSELPMKTAQSNLIGKDILNVSLETNSTNENKTENPKYRSKQIDLEAKTEICKAKKDPEFMKYFVMRQDALIDENPHFTEDDVLFYLYKTWLYEGDRKSNYVKCDEIKQSKLVKGVSLKSVARPNKVKNKDKHDTSTDGEKPVKNSIDFFSKIPIVKLSKIVNGDGMYPKEKNHAKAGSKGEEKQRRKWIRIKDTSDDDQMADSESPEKTYKLDGSSTKTLFQVKTQIVSILDQTKEPVMSETFDKDLKSIEVQEVLSNGEVNHETLLLDATVEDNPNVVKKQNLNLNVTKIVNSKIPPINLKNIPLTEINQVICEDKSSHIKNMLETSLQKPNSKTTSPCLKANNIDPAIKQEIPVSENQTSQTSETENMISLLNVDQKSETVSVASIVEDNIPLTDISKNAIKPKYCKIENERVLNDRGIETKLKRSRGRPKKKTEIDTFRENAEFMKYVEMRQDALIDEYPHFTESDIIMYLHKTWTYEEHLKSDHVKNDEIDQANLVKGLGGTIATKPKKFKVISNSKELKIYITAEKSETGSIKNDVGVNIPISEIPKSVKDNEKDNVSPDKIKQKPKKKQKAQDHILSKKIDNEKAKEDPEFLKYLDRHQDSLTDENPHVSEADIISYLYKTWVYEEDLKSDHMKNDDIELSNLVKGLGNVPEQQQKKLKKKIKLEKASQPTKVVSPNDKPKRKVAKAYYNEDDTDIETELKLFEIFKMKPKVQLKAPEKLTIEPSYSQESQSKFSQEIDVIVNPEQVKQVSEENEEEYDEVEYFFEELTAPKPNVFKGLTRERVCEICESTNNLVKCKGPCAGMFHLECVKKDDEPVVIVQPIKTRGRKKKKPRGLGRKSRSLDESESQSDEKHDNVDEQNISIDDSQEHIIIDLDSFEAQLETKMKEMIEIDTNLGYESYESDDESNWKDTIAGKCEIVDVKPKPKPIDPRGFKCNNCQKHNTPICFVCKSTTSPKNNKDLRQKCQVAHCHKYYHLECLDHWPQTQFNSGEPSRNNKKISEHFEALSCPRHVCHTCVCDDPRGCKTRFSGDKLARCVRCPATYHSFTKCLPAGTTILSGSFIICPRHYEHRPGKVPCHVNTGWCFICALGGTLICCEYCPTSFHAECLNIAPPEGNYMCEDCETGRLPLYGEMVWVKLGHYRWWPGIILHPFSIPENIMSVKHSRGEFVVRFFGQYDHYWVNRGRVFPFQEGDNGRVSSQKSKIDEAFTVAMEHAKRACEIFKKAAPNEVEDTDIASSLLPPHYVKLKVNKPCGTLLTWRPDDEENSLTLCECGPRDPAPCGPDTHCLNRMLLTECGPTCRAGDRCHNRSFEKRLYPKLVPYRTPHRGWGLKTLDDIKQGQFVIEYVGELIDEDEFKRRMQRKHEIRDENFYFLTLDKDRMIDAGPKGNLARFMNHSCEPNCETQKWTVLGDVRVGLFALKDIPANSEVTFNYNLECAGIDKKKCMCGARRCSGYIGAKPKQLLEDIQPKKIRLPKRKYNKKGKKTEDLPSVSKTKVKKQPKPKELTEIEKDLLIIKNATNNSTPCSDSESGGRLGSPDKEEKAVKERPKTLKRKRVNFSTEEVIFYNKEKPSVKRPKKNSVCNQVGD